MGRLVFKLPHKIMLKLSMEFSAPLTPENHRVTVQFYPTAGATAGSKGVCCENNSSAKRLFDEQPFLLHFMSQT